MYFILTQPVTEPATLAEIYPVGATLTFKDMTDLERNHGVDNVVGRIVFTDSAYDRLTQPTR
jgi:hypothetical protein